MASANTKVAIVAVLVLLFEASSCAMAARHLQGPHGRFEDMPAVMSVNGFEAGEEGGPSECDGNYHSDKDYLVALSTPWYLNGRRCFGKISIRSEQTGRSVVATVVDECDTSSGCKDNNVGTSKAVWDALGLDTNVGEVPVTWSDS